MPKYLLIMRGTDESNAAMMANIDEMMATTRADPSDPRCARQTGPERWLMWTPC